MMININVKTARNNVITADNNVKITENFVRSNKTISG